MQREAARRIGAGRRSCAATSCRRHRTTRCQMALSFSCVPDGEQRGVVASRRRFAEAEHLDLHAIPSNFRKRSAPLGGVEQPVAADEPQVAALAERRVERPRRGVPRGAVGLEVRRKATALGLHERGAAIAARVECGAGEVHGVERVRVDAIGHGAVLLPAAP